ncbi:MAG: flagellar M-ring protein FliF [Clostridiales bacterium]|nr:flagellar M-ring protein FliF [Clostridiales bacterium]
MTSKLKEFWGKVKNAVKKVPKKVLVLVSTLVVLGVVGLIIFFSVRQSPYSVLFTGLNSDEATAIMTYLEGQGVTDYHVENNDTILVPTNQETDLKAKLLLEGYPKSGFSYSTYYDHVGSLSTESERNTAYLLSLQDRMGAVIRCFDGVKDAVVTVTPGTSGNYVLDASNKVGTSAGVFVTMRSGQMLTDQQAEAIRTLVSHSVQELSIDSVSISDSAGNQYTAAGSTGQMNALDASDLKLRLEEQYNNIIRTSIMQVLSSIYGEDNVKVGVACNVDVNKTTQDKTDVFLPEWSTNGEGIIGSKVYDNYVVRNGDDTVGGVPGTSTNADFNSYMEKADDADLDGATYRESGQVDYDNPREETHTERVAGYLSDCMVSVSINSTVSGALSADDVQRLRSHVARAAGINDEMAATKISLYAAPFYNGTVPADTNPVGEANRINMLLLCVAAGLLVLLLLTPLFMLIFGRKKRRKRKEINIYRQPEDVVYAPQPEQPVGADVMSLQSEKTMELRKDIRKFADDNPEIAAQMLRNMLRGGEKDG